MFLIFFCLTLHFYVQSAETEKKKLSCKQYRVGKKITSWRNMKSTIFMLKEWKLMEFNYQKINDAVPSVSSLDTALNRHIRFKFIYKLFHPERNSKKCMQTCLQTYSQFYILHCFVRHLTWERLYTGKWFFCCCSFMQFRIYTAWRRDKFKLHKQLSGVLSGSCVGFLLWGIEGQMGEFAMKWSWQTEVKFASLKHFVLLRSPN